MTLLRAILYCLLINVLIYIIAFILLPNDGSFWYTFQGSDYEIPAKYLLSFAAQFGFLFRTEFLVEMFDTDLFRGENRIITAIFPVTLLIWAIVLSPLFVYFYQKRNK
jgi:hypothetical protein